MITPEPVFRRSSYSNGGGANCLEAGLGQPRTVVFRNATNGTGSNCVDVGAWRDTVIVRDSKDCAGDLGDYPTLEVPSGGWTAFTAELKAGRFDG